MGLVWLDGRQFAAAEKDDSIAREMTLRFRQVEVDGTPGIETLVDGRVCDCCQTDAAMTPKGPVVVYRDRTEEEIQDEAQEQLDEADVDIVGCSCSATASPQFGGMWGRLGMWLLAGCLAVMRRKDRRPKSRSTGYTVRVNR